MTNDNDGDDIKSGTEPDTEGHGLTGIYISENGTIEDSKEIGRTSDGSETQGGTLAGMSIGNPSTTYSTQTMERSRGTESG
jgi:hypothetical protein